MAIPTMLLRLTKHHIKYKLRFCSQLSRGGDKFQPKRFLPSVQGVIHASACRILLGLEVCVIIELFTAKQHETGSLQEVDVFVLGEFSTLGGAIPFHAKCAASFLVVRTRTVEN